MEEHLAKETKERGTEISKYVLWNRPTSLVAATSPDLLLLVPAFSSTVESPREVANAGEAGGAHPAAVTGFLGPDASTLRPEGGGALAWFYPKTSWQSYARVVPAPLQFWEDTDSKVSPEHQQTLPTFFYDSLQTNLQKSSFTLTDQTGPRVVKLQFAIMAATAAVPGLCSVSVVLPQARILNTAQSAATDSYAFLGSTEAEMKTTDLLSDELLAETVDQGAVALV